MIRRVLRAIIALALYQTGLVRARWAMLSHVGVSIERGVHFAVATVIQVTDGGVLRIGQSTTFGRGVTLSARGGVLNVGKRSEIGPWCTLVTLELIEIGDDCLIAERVSIRDQDHEIRGVTSIPIRLAGMSVAPVRLGNDVWIGAGAIILKGVTIGDGAVVAANAVVTRDVGLREIVAGVPARVIGTRVEHK